jgi:isoleucyl-tRNA synthetase
VQRLLREGAYERDGDRISVGGHVLSAGDYEERVSPREGLTVEHEGAIAVGVDTVLDDALVDEGIARDLVHHLQALRRDGGLAVTDRIRVRYAANDRGRRVLEAHGTFIAGEVLAVALEPGDPDGGLAVSTEGAEVTLSITPA